MLSNLSFFHGVRRLALVASFVFAAGAVACGSSDPDNGGQTGGTSGNTGGSSQTGGSSATGGAATGGAATGGAATGGAATGGAATGGAATGGASTGGAAGGAATGGRGGSAATGGAPMGGAGGSACGAETYTSTYMAFFSKYCISCHGSTATGRPKLDTLANVKTNAAKVKTEAATGTMMPPSTASAKPTSAERKALGAWIDCGLP